MFTDMVGYTALGQRNETLSLALVEEQRKLIRPILAKHNGREVKTIGDAFLVEFPNAVDPVRCAYDIQRAIREFNFSLASDKRIHLRIGIHLGEVVEAQGDISGDAVNVASRIEPLAEDGGVCLTRQVFDHVHNKFELPLTSLGPKSLKNVVSPVEVYRVVMPWEEEKPGSLTPADKRRIAVLPLKNISHDQSDEYFADGMTEELINALSHVEGLKVIARTSVERYKENPKPISEIGLELGVGSVMEGSVRKAGDRVRVTAQLIDAATEEHLWSENYDRRVEDIFAIQSEVAGMVAEALKTRLEENQRKRLEAGPTSNPEAYDQYLLAKHSNTRDPFTRIGYYQKAIELDPNFALAHADLAYYYIEVSGDFVPQKQAFSKARGYIERALELDDQLASAWNAKGDFAIQCEWNWHEAERCFRKAIDLNPNESTSYANYCFLCNALGRYDEAIHFALKERALNPYPPILLDYVAISYALAKKNHEAIRECTRLSELYPNDPNAHLWSAQTYGLLGMAREAAEELDKLQDGIRGLRDRGEKGWTAGVPTGYYALNMFSYAATGQAGKIRGVIDEAERASKHEYVSQSTVGTLYLAYGDKGKAFEFLERSVDEREPTLFMYYTFLIRLLKQTPELYDSTASDPRFVSLLQKVGYNKVRGASGLNSTPIRP
jgi:adenylate cyclase